jgi:integration host factor subunit beta
MTTGSVTKSQLIDELTLLYPRFPQQALTMLVEAVFATLTAALAWGERIELRGFGSFGVKARPARTRRNPRTQARVHVVAQSVPCFKVAKELRARVNGAARSGEVSLAAEGGERSAQRVAG